MKIEKLEKISTLVLFIAQMIAIYVFITTRHVVIAFIAFSFYIFIVYSYYFVFKKSAAIDCLNSLYRKINRLNEEEIKELKEAGFPFELIKNKKEEEN